MILLLDGALKVAVIVFAALVSMPLLRKSPAALRHWVLAAAVVSAVVAPVLSAAVPVWHLPLNLTLVPPDGVRRAVGSAMNAVPLPPVSGPDETDRRDASGFAAALLTIWMAGVGAGSVVLLTGLIRLRRLASCATPIAGGTWTASASRIAPDYNVRPPILLRSLHPSLLVTWGVRQPKVLVPAGALNWAPERVAVVLSHELAHIRRGDWIVQLAAELLRVVYWFNPLVWAACNRLRRESEQACDDAVMNRGVEGTEYATHLVDIARELQQRRLWVPAPSIARTSTLERRVRAMLDPHINRRPVSRSASLAILVALLAVVLPVTGVAVAQVFATVAGSIVDPTNGAVPGVTLVLTNTQTQAKHEVRSDRAGRYEFVGLVAGEYLLEASVPGFAVLRGTLTVAGQNLQQDLKLQIGSLHETISVRASRSRSESHESTSTQAGRRAQAREPPTCGTVGEGSTPTGGNIRPPQKLLDVRPQYPAGAVRDGALGTVILAARIGTSGLVEEVKIVSTPHPDLAAAAADAVRQWEFDTTYLNCVAVPVNMEVTVNFELEP
jgi:TonB family protein